MRPQTAYNPECAPNPSEWLATSEQERMRLVFSHHMIHRLKSAKARAHAAAHVIVENQIALGFGPTVRAMARLQAQGLCRHDALHAIGSVLAESMFQATRETTNADTTARQAQINSAIERLDAHTWRET